MTQPFWSASSVATLTQMVAEGATYQAIGDRLGCTKNAAIGKARRLGITDAHPGSAIAISRRAAPTAMLDRFAALHARMDAVLAETRPWVEDRKPLICPHCGGSTGVIDSRPAYQNAIRRRRVCYGCQKRFTTFEIVTDDNPADAARKLRQKAIELREMASMLDDFAKDQEATSR